jgi:hypothetical protein
MVDALTKDTFWFRCAVQMGQWKSTIFTMETISWKFHRVALGGEWTLFKTCPRQRKEIGPLIMRHGGSL